MKNNIENGITKEMMAAAMNEAINSGVIDDKFIGMMLDSAKKKREASEAEIKIIEEARGEDLVNSKRLDEIVGAIDKWHQLGVRVIRIGSITDMIRRTTESPEKFTIKVDDCFGDVFWEEHGVIIPGALLMKCYDQAVGKYGVPLIRDIITTFEKGGIFWEKDVSKYEIPERGTRLVETLKKRGWNPEMQQWEYDTWKRNLPEGIIPVIIRTIMTGATGHMNCLGCKYAIFDDSGYCRCCRKTDYVPINGNRLAGYISFAKKKEVYADCVYSDVIRDITAECPVRKKVCSEEQLRFNQAYYRKHNK